MAHEPLQQKFTAALDALIAEVKADRSVLAALLCGSLAHDTVWTKSDIDLVLVTIDDKQVERGGLSPYRDGVNVHAILIPCTEFRRMVEGSVRNSFAHSFLTKGRLLYTHDPTIAALCATHALPPIDKAHKWFVTRGDLDYTALWILYAAAPLAQLDVIQSGAAGRSRSDPRGWRSMPPCSRRSTATCSMRRRLESECRNNRMIGICFLDSTRITETRLHQPLASQLSTAR
jgi:predicted nucleotidyltransferase